MPAAVIDLRSAEDPRDVVHRVVQALAEGKIVALPTETVYGLAVSALNEHAVTRLGSIKGRPETQPFTLAIKSDETVLDYVPRIDPVAQRLARRCWPGPMTLVLEYDREESLIRQLPSVVQKAVAPDTTIGFRVPAHELVLSVLRLTAGPLALTSANRHGKPDAVSAQDVVAAFGADVDLVIDDGKCKFSQPSSVVRIGTQGVKMLRPGVINEAALRRLSSLMVLFVCTGNTCRSPMAEWMLKHRLSERLRCQPNDLEEHGVLVASAGISAMAGGRATAETMHVMQERGIDVGTHESQPINERLIRYADLILTMTAGHRDALLAQWPEARPRVHLLGDSCEDIADPFGSGVEHYRKCLQDIEACIDLWVQKLDRAGLLPGSTSGE